MSSLPCWAQGLVPGEHTARTGGTGRLPTESWRAIRKGLPAGGDGEWVKAACLAGPWGPLRGTGTSGGQSSAWSLHTRQPLHASPSLPQLALEELSSHFLWTSVEVLAPRVPAM